MHLEVRKSPEKTPSQREMKLQFIVLLMNGNDREALRVTRPVLRRRRDSSPSGEAVGGLFVDFEPLPGVPRSRGSLATRTLSHDHVDDNTPSQRLH